MCGGWEAWLGGSIILLNKTLRVGFAGGVDVCICLLALLWSP